MQRLLQFTRNGETKQHSGVSLSIVISERASVRSFGALAQNREQFELRKIKTKEKLVALVYTYSEVGWRLFECKQLQNQFCFLSEIPSVFKFALMLYIRSRFSSFTLRIIRAVIQFKFPNKFVLFPLLSCFDSVTCG